MPHATAQQPERKPIFRDGRAARPSSVTTRPRSFPPHFSRQQRPVVVIGGDKLTPRSALGHKRLAEIPRAWIEPAPGEHPVGRTRIHSDCAAMREADRIEYPPGSRRTAFSPLGRRRMGPVARTAAPRRNCRDRSAPCLSGRTPLVRECRPISYAFQAEFEHVIAVNLPGGFVGRERARRWRATQSRLHRLPEC